MRIINKEIGHHIIHKLDFISNSACGYTDDELGYVVKSYNTVIYSEKEGLNEQKYSSTTSKIQNIIRKIIDN